MMSDEQEIDDDFKVRERYAIEQISDKALP
jgi:hypothetical protein